MPTSAPVQPRIALALVLLEHKPDHLDLHDYLGILKDEVRSRAGKTSMQASSTVPGHVGEPATTSTGAFEPERAANEAVKIGQEVGAWGDAPAAPQDPSLLLDIVKGVRHQLDACLAQEEADPTTLAATLADVEGLLSWVMERLSSLVISPLPRLLSEPLALPYFAALFIRFTSTFPSSALSAVVPLALDRLCTHLLALDAPTAPLNSLSSRADEVPPLLSLIHLILTSLPPDLTAFLPPSDLAPLKASTDRLVLAVTSPSVESAFFAIEGDERLADGLESRVLGILEGVWTLMEALNVQS
ncbi:hypothetical protein JCM8097_002252 [Rhodosporidiobolus ruineniae]